MSAKPSAQANTRVDESKVPTGRRVPDLVLTVDRTKESATSRAGKFYYELRVQCEIELEGPDEARELFELLHGKDRANDGVTKAHEIIKPKLKKDDKSLMFQTLVHLGFIDNGSKNQLPAELLEALCSAKK